MITPWKIAEFEGNIRCFFLLVCVCIVQLINYDAVDVDVDVVDDDDDDGGDDDDYYYYYGVDCVDCVVDDDDDDDDDDDYGVDCVDCVVDDDDDDDDDVCHASMCLGLQWQKIWAKPVLNLQWGWTPHLSPMARGGVPGEGWRAWELTAFVSRWRCSNAKKLPSLKLT